MKLFAGSFEATYEGYMMSKRADRKLQSKVKMFRSEHAVHFPPTPISLVKKWHQMMVISMIKKLPRFKQVCL
jgi:hypothetical protein